MNEGRMCKSAGCRPAFELSVIGKFGFVSDFEIRASSLPGTRAVCGYLMPRTSAMA
jgi:hypothetical protein